MSVSTPETRRCRRRVCRMNLNQCRAFKPNHVSFSLNEASAACWGQMSYCWGELHYTLLQIKLLYWHQRNPSIALNLLYRGRSFWKVLWGTRNTADYQWNSLSVCRVLMHQMFMKSSVLPQVCVCVSGLSSFAFIHLNLFYSLCIQFHTIAPDRSVFRSYTWWFLLSAGLCGIWHTAEAALISSVLIKTSSALSVTGVSWVQSEFGVN